MPERLSTPSNPESSRNLGLLPWWIAGISIVSAALLVVFGRGSLPKPGQSANYTITIVPADARGLACASNVTLGGRRCGFDDKSQPVPVDRPLRPFVTTGRELLLLSGVFESRDVAAWLDAALKHGDETRVTLECRGHDLGVMQTVSVHWSPDSMFQPEHAVAGADVENCVVKK